MSFLPEVSRNKASMSTCKTHSPNVPVFNVLKKGGTKQSPRLEKISELPKAIWKGCVQITIIPVDIPVYLTSLLV